MCVIMVCEDTKPSPDMLRAGFRANDKGAGIAWRENTPADKKAKTPASTKVRWKKAITDPEEVVQMVDKLPLPFVVHFRIPSIGGGSVDLTHPFPIRKGVELDHEGTADEVLFHNGTWHRWDDEMFKAALLKGVKLPRAPFSDSRMMAWLTHLLGRGFLDKIDEKVIVFSANDIEIFGENRGWVNVEGIWCSNDHFRRFLDKRQEKVETPLVAPRPVVMGPTTPLRQLKGDATGGRRAPVGFRPGPTVVGQPGPSAESEGVHQQERVQDATNTLREAASQSPRVLAGVRRGPLTESEIFIQEYRKLNGHPPPFTPQNVDEKTWAMSLNPKDYRRGSPITQDDLRRRRGEAAKGISRVLEL